VEGDFVRVRVNSGGVVRSCFVKEDEMNYCYCSNDKRQEEVECKESGQCGIIYGKAAPDSLN